MKLVRPYIPLAIRVHVAERQVMEAGFANLLTVDGQDKKPLRDHLSDALDFLFGDEKRHLDHDPALVNRHFNPKTKKYTPDANDPRFLIYRSAQDHKIKTYIRGIGAQRSDLGQRRYLKKLADNREKQRKKHREVMRKVRFKSRPLKGESQWPKGRKIATRKFRNPPALRGLE